jgi:hypothetical protein
VFVHMGARAGNGLISFRLYARYSEAVKRKRQRTHAVWQPRSSLRQLAPLITFWEKVAGITSFVSNEAVTVDWPCVADHPPDTYAPSLPVARRHRPFGSPWGAVTSS